MNAVATSTIITASSHELITDFLAAESILADTLLPSCLHSSICAWLASASPVDDTTVKAAVVWAAGLPVLPAGGPALQPEAERAAALRLAGLCQALCTRLAQEPGLGPKASASGKRGMRSRQQISWQRSTHCWSWWRLR